MSVIEREIEVPVEDPQQDQPDEIDKAFCAIIGLVEQGVWARYNPQRGCIVGLIGITVR